MQGKFAALINMFSFGFGFGVFVLSINFLVGPIGTGTAYHDDTVDTFCDSKTDKEPEKSMRAEGCTGLSMVKAAAALGIVLSLAQMIVCALAMATKLINWIVWVIGHVIVFIFCLIAMSLVFASYKKDYQSPENKCDPLKSSSKPKTCMHFPTTSMHDMESLDSMVYLYGVILLFDLLFCIVANVLMFMKRDSTKEQGEQTLLVQRAESVVRKVSGKTMSTPVKQSRTGSKAEPSQAARKSVK